MNQRPRVGAVLLAAGGSRRLGRPKQLLDWRGEPLVRHAAETVLAARVDRVAAVVGHRRDEVVESLAGSPIELVENPRWSEGQSTSVRAGLDALEALDPPDVSDASSRLVGALFVPCDQPRLRTATLDRLLDAARIALATRPEPASRIVVPVYGTSRRRGAPVFFGREHFAALRALEGDVGGRRLLAEHPECVVEVAVADEREAEDVDTAEDWARFNRARFRGRAGR